MQQRKNNVILDSSALLAFWNDEPGWENIEIHQGKCLISAVNAAEVIGCLIKNGVQAQKANAAVVEFVSSVVPFNHEQACTSGALILESKKFGLSLGDRACIGLALQGNLPVLTGNRVWEKLNMDVDVRVFR